MPYESALTLVEPASLIRHFVAHPPHGFAARVGAGGLPVFTLRFDVLTTAAPATRARIDRWPLAKLWRRWLSLPATFIGTTVSEYLPLPAGIEPQTLATHVLASESACQPLTILKDLPLRSPLLSPVANRFSADLAAECASRGCVLLEGQALAYVPIDFRSTGEYLARLSTSRRRDLRRKLRSESSLQVDIVQTGSGTLTPHLVAEIYALYLNVYEQSSVHFDCLRAEFFAAVLNDASCGGVLFLYRHAGELIGFNLCFEHEDKLVDKYVGFRYPQARDHNLYFVSWFRNLDYARERGLQFYIAGWTDPQVKQQLGARFTWTRHAVYVRNALLRAVLRAQRRRFEADHEWHAQAGDHAAHHS
jgi:hypothetical protein